MADQVDIRLPKTRYNEGSQFEVTAVFKTRASQADSVPTTAEYKLFNLNTREIIKDWTTLTPAASITFTISATDNDIRKRKSTYERIQILVSADRGLSTQVIEDKTYLIKNLRGYGDR